MGGQGKHQQCSGHLPQHLFNRLREGRPLEGHGLAVPTAGNMAAIVSAGFMPAAYKDATPCPVTFADLCGFPAHQQLGKLFNQQGQSTRLDAVSVAAGTAACGAHCNLLSQLCFVHRLFVLSASALQHDAGAGPGSGRWVLAVRMMSGAGERGPAHRSLFQPGLSHVQVCRSALRQLQQHCRHFLEAASSQQERNRIPEHFKAWFIEVCLQILARTALLHKSG